MSTFEELYDITVRKHLDSDALVFFEEKTRKIMTFKEFDETVDKYALFFEEHFKDIDKGSWIGLSLPNSPAWLAILFSLQKCGYNVVLTDENASFDLLEHFINETGMKAIVSSDNEKNLDITQINISDIKPGQSCYDSGTSDWASKMAFCTSGTTGTAGVYVFNADAIVHSCKNIVRYYYANEDLVTKTPEGAEGENPILALPLRHISGFTLAFAFWTIGKCLVFPCGKGILDLINTVKQEKIWLLFCVPAMWKAILRIMKVKYGDISPESFKKMLGDKLRIGISAAATLDDTMAEELIASGLNILNCWGMTETGICSVGRLGAKDKGSYVGSPVNGHEIKVIRENGPEPSGIGELLIEGKSVFEAVMKGGSEIKRKSPYRSGDIFRYEDGKLNFMGRCKSVIIGESGENVYPEEIDMYFNFLSGRVHSFCTVGYEDEPALFVGLDPADVIDEKDILDDIQKTNMSLPAIKQLTRLFIVGEKLPHTSKGEPARMKLDRRYVESNNVKIIKLKGRKI